MNKTIYEAEFTKMVHDKMREANRFKEYERIQKNRIGGDYWNKRTSCSGMERTGKNVYEIPERYKAKFKSGTVLNRACEAYGDYLKEEANNKDDEYEEGEEE